MSESSDGKSRGLSWVARPLACDGRVVLDGLDVDGLADADLRDICLRMHVILDTIEMPRCEGRLLPTNLFDRMDTLESRVFHGPGTPRMSEWETVVREFGDHYELNGDGSSQEKGMSTGMEIKQGQPPIFNAPADSVTHPIKRACHGDVFVEPLSFR